MPRRAWILLAVAALAAGVLGWGYWYAAHHASVHLSVDDYGLRTERRLYGTPHGVTLALRDAQGAQLAIARSVEPLGYLLAAHPSVEIGDCRQHAGSHAGYATCYEQYSAWLAQWAPRVRSADVQVGSCALRAVPVEVHRSNDEWPVWWVPLPHVGGLPRQYFTFRVPIDSRGCKPVPAPPVR